MTFSVTFRPGARADLLSLYDYIEERSGLNVAEGYIDRIESACLALGDFPEHGTRRDELALGVRTLGFERRATIVFRATPAGVQIIAIAYGGRQLTSELIDRAE